MSPLTLPPESTRFASFRAFASVAGAFALATLLAAGFSGCQKAEDPGIVLAQVDDAVLTLEELREIFPEEYEQILPREQYLDLIQRWIDDEAVHQEALRRRLHEEPQVRRKLERLQRRMLVEELMARETSAGALTEPDEGAMMRYYENNKAEFRRRAPEYRYMHIRVATLREALDLRRRVRSNNFAALATEHSLDAGLDMAHIPFRRPSEIPSCLHEMLEAQAGWLSNPLSCPDGIYLVRLQERIEAGTPLPFAEVRAAISAQLAMQHRERMRESKIRQYKEGLAIRLNVDLIPGVEAAGAPPQQGDDPELAPDESYPGE